jgi:hypothetical protein
MNLNDEPAYQTIVIAELQRKLPEGVEIKTCEDFKHLNVECCDTCHNFYPHYEMKVIQYAPDCSRLNIRAARNLRMEWSGTRRVAHPHIGQRLTNIPSEEIDSAA